ncbi:MAG TPA: hypothetical protein VNU68_04565 [Verrucomicrobiae bacterium]|nr:hypothetical protein [Verrucomicrobiae bacterium]
MRLSFFSVFFCPGLLLNVSAASLFVPNHSFESPRTDFAGPDLGSWQKAPPAPWYNDPRFPWDQLMGQFLNTSNGSPNYIDNLDGHQAAYLFALPQVEIFQDLNTAHGTDWAAARAFNAQFEAGKSYTLTVGLLGGGGGMSNGATFEIALYFTDAASNRITVGAATITNSLELFPTNSHLRDFQVRIPLVKPTDAWAGKRIGVRLASTVGFDLIGGYWDVDNVRLTESTVPNASFEVPETIFASPEVGSWQKASQPFWYDDPRFPWDQLIGQFVNTSNGSPDHIDNMEGNQAAYIFALPDVAMFQDYNSIGGTNVGPAHEFGAKFEAGKSYALTVGVLGGSGGMSNGATLQISLYYRDAASNRVILAATTVTNSLDLFPTNARLTDFQVTLPLVRSNDSWAGQWIGIELASTVGFDLLGGYWDVDNVRLTESLLPNSSFESPATTLATPDLDGWQKASQPVWYNDPRFPWEQLMGQFLNTSAGSPDHIDNLDGRQAAYLFALPDVAIFQDYNSVAGTNRAPAHDFNARFEVGKSYSLTVGILGGGGGMSNGATLEISLYYRDDNSNAVTVAATTVTNTTALFPTNTHLPDFQVQVPTLTGGEAWAGKYIGVRLASTVGFDLLGGYWDVDNVRLTSVKDPVLENVRVLGGELQFTLNAAPGRYETLATTDLTLPSSRWTNLGVVTNLTGRISVSDSRPNPHHFYQVRPSP